MTCACNKQKQARIGGGCTAFQCGLDTVYHQPMSHDLQEMEQVDFQAQQLAAPWKVPSRSRQALLDDVGAWWSAWPHARKGRECLQQTGMTNALPPCDVGSLWAADGTYVRAKYALVGPEDHLIIRDAKVFWKENSMEEERAHALADVHQLYPSLIRSKLKMQPWEGGGGGGLAFGIIWHVLEF